MKVLVACEESQAVTIELRKLGHEAYSSDILPCTGGHPEWHLQGDVVPIIYDESKNWELMIAFPPCTYLTVTGNRWHNVEEYGTEAIQRNQKREEAIVFFMKMVLAPIPKIAIENPIGIMSTVYKEPDQKIQPYYFGEPFQKATCLWLKDLDLLERTNTVSQGEFTTWITKSGKKKRMPKWYNDARGSVGSSKRSKTFPGIAKAMAEQWTKPRKQLTLKL